MDIGILPTDIGILPTDADKLHQITSIMSFRLKLGLLLQIIYRPYCTLILSSVMKPHRDLVGMTGVHYALQTG